MTTKTNTTSKHGSPVGSHTSQNPMTSTRMFNADNYRQLNVTNKQTCEANWRIGRKNDGPGEPIQNYRIYTEPPFTLFLSVVT